MTIEIKGNPITKKNSQRIITLKGRPAVIPSKQFKRYEKEALEQLPQVEEPLNKPLTISCLYYMQTRRRVDLTNLLEATDDILVRAGIIADDNCKIIVSHDGSRVFHDKENPRVEITIEEYKE